MKKLSGILILAALFAACNDNSSVDKNTDLRMDTTHIYPTNPATENEEATHSQPILRDSIDPKADSIADSVPRR